MNNTKNIPVIFPPGTIMRYDQEGIAVDPNGSYTGISKNPWEQPVQDADDL